MFYYVRKMFQFELKQYHNSIIHLKWPVYLERMLPVFVDCCTNGDGEGVVTFVVNSMRIWL
jgi:hypothetical protein